MGRRLSLPHGQFGREVEVQLGGGAWNVPRDVVADAHHVPAGHAGRFHHRLDHGSYLGRVVAGEHAQDTAFADSLQIIGVPLATTRRQLDRTEKAVDLGEQLLRTRTDGEADHSITGQVHQRVDVQVVSQTGVDEIAVGHRQVELTACDTMQDLLGLEIFGHRLDDQGRLPLA